MSERSPLVARVTNDGRPRWVVGRWVLHVYALGDRWKLHQYELVDAVGHWQAAGTTEWLLSPDDERIPLLNEAIKPYLEPAERWAARP